uniref:Uncharacterized protein n=1 Tax=Strongyloides venezuelensis TaxID=75913 RepID=A0A0K0FBB1_STRVS
MYTKLYCKRDKLWVSQCDLETGEWSIDCVYSSWYARVVFVYRILYITNSCDDMTVNYKAIDHHILDRGAMVGAIADNIV